MSRRVRRMGFALAVILTLVAAGCGGADDDRNGLTEGDEGSVVGVVSEVSGELPVVDTFVILDGSGDSFRFIPEPGLLFHGGPLSHLRDHIVGGERVTVTFKVESTGVMTATHIEHSG